MFVSITYGNHQMFTTEEWINKTWQIHAMNYYLTVKRNEVLITCCKWRNPENTLPSEGSQIERPHVA
jgi:hypothetical protein